MSCRQLLAGFGEGGSAEGAELRRRTLEAAKPHLVRILGPNCLGFISPARGINASFAHLTPLTGAVVTLLEPQELRWLAITRLGAEIERRGMEWVHMPIPDVSTPGAALRG